MERLMLCITQNGYTEGYVVKANEMKWEQFEDCIIIQCTNTLTLLIENVGVNEMADLNAAYMCLSSNQQIDLLVELRGQAKVRVLKREEPLIWSIL